MFNNIIRDRNSGALAFGDANSNSPHPWSPCAPSKKPQWDNVVNSDDESAPPASKKIICAGCGGELKINERWEIINCDHCISEEIDLALDDARSALDSVSCRRNR